MLQIEGLKKTYPGFTLNVDMRIDSGRITGLIGENGAGKTTLFKSILGLIHPDGGAITVFGKSIRDFTADDKRAIGTVLAESGFSGHLALQDVTEIMKSFYPAFDEMRFAEQARRFSLPENKLIKEYSTGMKAKLKVLIALSYNAKLLILDEPTAGLDVTTREDVLQMLRDYMAESEERSILVSSHISSDLESLCDDFYMIHKGNIIMHEDTDRLLSDYAILKVTEEDYNTLDKQYILYRRKESFGYLCLTNERAYYMENAPHIVLEKSGIDDLILLAVRGERIAPERSD